MWCVFKSSPSLWEVSGPWSALTNSQLCVVLFLLFYTFVSIFILGLLFTMKQHAIVFVLVGMKTYWLSL